MVEVSSESPIEIAGLIPHSGNMCLLQRIQACDDTTIECWADSHREASNPLRNASCLPVTAGIEYAAQAMAVHGALGASGSATPRSGYIAVLSRVEWFREKLDDLPGDLRITAQRLASSDSASNYQFEVSHEGLSLLQGQAVVALRD